MERKPRQQALLAALLVVLAALVVYRYWTAPSARPAAASNRKGPVATAPANRPPVTPQVRLNALNTERPTPSAGERNLFRFKPKPAPPPPPRPAATAGPPGAGTAPPAGPPPPAPIPLKFIGIVESPDRTQKIAVLSDGRGVHEGKEGDIILGQYKILRIGVESIEMAYLDGRGRQTIRLTGS